MPDLTPAEAQFFATGDAAHLQSAPADPAPVPAPAPAAPEPVAAPDPVAELRGQLDAERAQRARLEADFARVAAQVHAPAPAPAAPAAPDAATDPLGAMMHQLRTVTETTTRMQETLSAQQQAAVQQQQFNDFAANLQHVRDEFTKTTPDFPAAYAHLRTARADDLRDVGVPESRINEALLRDEIAATQNAVAQGKNPAAVMYNMARRYGYAAKGAATSEAARLAGVAAGAAAEGTAPGRAAATQPVTLEGLKDAGEADLNRLVMDDKQWNAIIGNRSNNIF